MPFLRHFRLCGRFLGGAAVLFLLLWRAVGADWEPELARFEALALAHPPPAGHILLLGSSSFRRWTNAAAAFPGRVVVNHGFGGSQYSDVLEHLDRLAPAAFRPAAILIYEGDNDLAAGETPAAVAREAKELVRRLQERFPGAWIGLLAVKPSPLRASLLDQQWELNLRLRRLAGRTAGVEFLDVATPLLGADDQPDPAWFVADRLHLNAAGYELWRGVLAPHVHRHAGGGD